MGKIKLIRNKSFNNQFRKISVYLNDTKACEISNNETIELKTEKTHNFVYIKLDWYKSQPVEIILDKEETIVLEIVNFKTKNKTIKLIVWFLLLILSPFLSKFTLFQKSIYFILALYILIDLIRFSLSMTKYSNSQYISLRKINTVTTV